MFKWAFIIFMSIAAGKLLGELVFKAKEGITFLIKKLKAWRAKNSANKPSVYVSLDHLRYPPLWGQPQSIKMEIKISDKKDDPDKIPEFSELVSQHIKRKEWKTWEKPDTTPIVGKDMTHAEKTARIDRYLFGFWSWGTPDEGHYRFTENKEAQIVLGENRLLCVAHDLNLLMSYEVDLNALRKREKRLEKKGVYANANK